MSVECFYIYTNNCPKCCGKLYRKVLEPKPVIAGRETILDRSTVHHAPVTSTLNTVQSCILVNKKSMSIMFWVCIAEFKSIS